MRVAIHQPHFLPWLGYWNKAANCDAFVWLHDVQYEKNGFQNRTRIRTPEGRVRWLTVPVHAPFPSRIDEVRIADTKWQRRVCGMIENCYRDTPWFASLWAPIKEAILFPSDRLEELDGRTFLKLNEMLGLEKVRVVRASDLGIDESDPSRRLARMCVALGATQYIAGRGGRNYLELERFQEASVEVLWQEFDADIHPYLQRGEGFVPALSVIDALFNLGPQSTRALIESSWVCPEKH